jgi:hypothetical protein
MSENELKQIVWGDGKVKMQRFIDKSDGSFGLILSDAGDGHKPMDYEDTPREENHEPKPGEFYLRFKNKAGLQALLFSLIELLTDTESFAQRRVDEAVKGLLEALASQVKWWEQVPSGVDYEADLDNQSPYDSTAHIAGLAVREAKKSLEKFK